MGTQLKKNQMNSFEKSALIGYYRSGATLKEIGFIMGISASYVEMIVKEYLNGKR